MDTDQRSSSRDAPSIAMAIVRGISDKSVVAQIIDESFSGLGLIVPVSLVDHPGLQAGCQIRIELANTLCTAIVRHLSEHPSGTRLGVEWKAAALTSSLSSLPTVTFGKYQSVANHLPKGLSRMWKLYEAQDWERLTSHADKLRKEAAKHFVFELDEMITTFQEVVRKETAIAGSAEQLSTKIESALNKFVHSCVTVLVQSSSHRECLT